MRYFKYNSKWYWTLIIQAYIFPGPSNAVLYQTSSNAACSPKHPLQTERGTILEGAGRVLDFEHIWFWEGFGQSVGITLWQNPDTQVPTFCLLSAPVKHKWYCGRWELKLLERPKTASRFFDRGSSTAKIGSSHLSSYEGFAPEILWLQEPWACCFQMTICCPYGDCS